MTTEQLLSRRAVLGGALGLGLATLPGLAGAAPAFEVKGKIRDTYRANGGLDVLGRPLAGEVKIRIRHVNTYAQRFERGTVWWAAGQGRVDLPDATRVRLRKGENFRPVLGVVDLWRTDDLDGLPALDERIVRDLGIGTVIAMNSGSDPRITGVRNLKHVISNSGSTLTFYRGYVTRAASRAAAGKVLTAVAGSTAPVAVHCRRGKDRTGWVCDLMQSVAGVSRATRDADYLATEAYSGRPVELAWLHAAREACVERYGSTSAYLRQGCGLSSSTLARLERRLTA